ncbi:Hsp20/alpha crystallin family protein [Mesobacillus foraminis]|uniref:Hsp20/alpha crystallin family protein n=1 Tax=Mesobacillus foraminis TaxID=279826 RepID=UPI000EF4CA0B|nr:Hsp20/alpha crystallin family protein [Mesobacillus foraminis]
MEVEKLKYWLDLTRQYAAESFWKEAFSQETNPFLSSGHIQNLSLAPKGGSSECFPRCDLYKYEDKLFVEAELPGMVREHAAITLKGKQLTIRGNYSTFKPNLTYFLKERCDQSFEKNINLPFRVNHHEIQSNLDRGLLTIILPIISEEEAVPIHIEQSAPAEPPHQLQE